MLARPGNWLPAAVLAVGLLLGVAVPGVAQDEPAAPEASDDQAAGQGRITVMVRNLYLGADVGVALDLLPDMSAAAQYMWDQVEETDFDTRAEQLAAEAARLRPDVIGLQEATTWSCRHGLSRSVAVYDFTERYLEATKEAGVEYVVAHAGDDRAFNTGYGIPPILGLTKVHDPATFGRLFDSPDASCGFEIADALLVRSDLADGVLAAGTSEYRTRYAVLPVVFTIDRGYAWADIALAGTTVRFATTHAESLFDDGAIPPSAAQAAQLVDELSTTTLPLVVMGDFNADPRDPRGPDEPNPANQPTASATCPEQPANPTPETAQTQCNGYWTMRAGGYQDAGAPQDPANYTYGANALLAGPDVDRLEVAIDDGNQSGFTDRIDHIFVRNGAVPVSAEVVGGTWPDGRDMWACDSPGQVEATQSASAVLVAEGVLRRPVGPDGICLPSDHAGMVATIDVSAGPPGAVVEDPPPTHSELRLDLMGWLILLLILCLLLVGLLVAGAAFGIRAIRRRRSPDPVLSE